MPYLSTIGYEKINNWAFNEIDETKFIESLTSNQPAPPHHFAQMKQVNQFGMNLYQSYDVYPSLDNKRVAFDLRSKEAFHGGHKKEQSIYHTTKTLLIKLVGT